MGYCSNRGETHAEKIGRYAKEIFSTQNTSLFSWQISKGAEIRGTMGVDKGNKFIKAVKEVTNEI